MTDIDHLRTLGNYLKKCIYKFLHKAIMLVEIHFKLFKNSSIY